MPEDQVGLDALLNRAFSTYHACSAHLENPAWLGPPTAFGAGNRFVGDPAFIQQESGDYITQKWYLSVEDEQWKRTLRVKGIFAVDSPPFCDRTLYSGALGDRRSRTVDCPEGFRPNDQTQPIFAYCYRASQPNRVDPPKNLGKCKDCDLLIGHPTNIATGNKFLEEDDYRGAGVFPLEYTRRYNSLDPGTYAGPAFAKNLPKWRGTYDRAIRFNEHPLFPDASVYRHDGQVLKFKLVSGSFIPDADVNERLTRTVDGSGNTTGWTLTNEQNETETYDADGRLLEIRNRAGIKHTILRDALHRIESVTHSFGSQLIFAYDAENRPSTITLPGGGVIVYGYNNRNELTSVAYPDNKTRQYFYDSASPMRLTGVIDENNTQFATYTYSSGRVASSELAGGVDRYTFTYTSATRTTVVDALGQLRTYDFTGILGAAHANASSGLCIACRASNKAKTHDANGNVASRTNFKNVQTTYGYDLSRNLETTRTEAFGTPAARTIATQWHPTYRLPSTITEPNRTTSFTFDTAGNALTRTVTDTSVVPNESRTWTYTYNTFGQVLTENGPRTDVSDIATYTYYTCSTGNQCGQVHTISNALGQVTTFNTYNAHGQALSITDVNSVQTLLAYDARQRITSRQVGTETTTFTYWPTGLLKKVTLPDSSFLQYSYDDAHRLTKIEDGDGNHVDYTLDAAGNRTAESAYDPSSALARTRTQVFDALGQLWKDIGAAGTPGVTMGFGYDDQGNLTTIAAPLSRNTTNQYDELDRLKHITDAGGGLTQFTYNANDDLASVTDPRNAVTSYIYNGFGELKQQISPDTGTTIHSYDPAGNLAGSTDARSKSGTHAYDALNRVTSIAYPDLTTSFTYDSGMNGIGRLTGASDANHSLAFTYDSLGRLTRKSQSVGSLTKAVTYGYTNGNLSSLITPSGQTIGYSHSNGHITNITLNGTTTILDQVLYEPMGPISGWRWGNSSIAARVYDQDSRVSALDSAGLRNYTYDNASRITAIDDAENPALSATYAYDSADRLLPPGFAAPGSLQVALSSTNAAAGSTVVATLSNIPAGSGYWLALAPVGAAATTYNASTAVTSSNGSFVWNVSMPSYAGSYELRLFQGNFVLVHTSVPISVSAPPTPSQATLNPSVSTVTLGAGVTVRLAAGLGGAKDWLALAVSGAPTSQYLQWVYVGSGVTSRDWTVMMPTTTGDYVFRLFLNDGFTMVASSSIVRIRTQAPAGGTVVGNGPPSGNPPYDLNGNRLLDGTSTYTISPTSNRLTSINGALNRSYAYDTAGNVLQDGTRTFTYNDAGRLKTATRNGVTTTYTYNALGQRVKKSNSSLTRHFIYDESGHLLGEYDATGALIQEIVWLEDVPIATLRPNGSGVSLFYIHTDHLNTPRRISRPSDNAIVWRWDSDAFGTTAANENPDGDATVFAFNLRFPGQYADLESITNYNYMRDYDPATGRYVESDPIGLAASLNTYSYVDGDPVQYFDSAGLARCTYSISKHTVDCTSNAGDKTTSVGPDYVWSGLGPCKNNNSEQCTSMTDIGPVPPGNYRMNRDTRRGHEGFWRLEPMPKIPGWKCGLPFFGSRCGFMLHPGSVSKGCITASKDSEEVLKQYAGMNDLLIGEIPYNTLRVVP